VRDELALAWQIAKGLRVLNERHEIRRLRHQSHEDAGHLVERRLLRRKVGQWRRLPVGRRRLEKALGEVQHPFVPHP